jgi:hypothetical protein
MEVLGKVYELWLAGLDIAEEKDSALLCGALLAFGVVYVPFMAGMLEAREEVGRWFGKDCSNYPW